MMQARYSEAEFRILGMDSLTYVKPVMINGKPFNQVYGANGDVLCTLSHDRDVSFAHVKQYGLEPVSVH